MKYRNIISFIVILVLLSGIALATKPTILEPPDGYATNDPSIYLSWEIDGEDRSSFYLYEDGDLETCFEDDDPHATVNNYSDYSNGTLIFNRTEGIYQYKVETYEDDNCFADDSEDSDPITVTVDFTAPSFYSTDPGDGEEYVPVDTDVEVTFEENLTSVDRDYTENNFEMKDEAGEEVEGEFSWPVVEGENREKLRFRPQENLSYNAEEYTVEIEVRDEAGNKEDGDWSFYTELRAPELVQKDPGDGDKDVSTDTEVEMVFETEDELDWEDTKNSFEISEVDGPEVDGELEEDGEELTFTPDNELEQSTDYEVKVQPKDTRGNKGRNYTWEFQTEVPPEKIDVKLPQEGEIYSIDATRDIEIYVTDQEDNPVKGGSAYVTGIDGCRDQTLEGPEEDGKFIGSCNPQESGDDLKLVFTAENAGEETTKEITITLWRVPSIEIELIEPDSDKNYTRGDEVLLKVETKIEDEPFNADKVELRDYPIEFQTAEQDHIWEATYETDYGTPTTYQITVQAEGEYGDEENKFEADNEETITIELEKAELYVDVNYIIDGEEHETLKDEGGEDVRIKAEVTYPDGTAVEDLDEEGKIEGLLEIWEEGEEEPDQEPLTFNETHEDGIYISNQEHRVGGEEYRYVTEVEAEDEHENTGEGEKTVEGPGKTLDFELTQPDPRIATPGQTITISGYVEHYETEEPFTDPEVTVNNQSTEITPYDHYEVENYTIPTTAEVNEEYELTTHIEHEETLYEDTQWTITLEPPTININEERLEERGLRRYEQFTATITYPNGDPVTEGEYHIEIEEKNYTLNYNPETERWETKEIDLGRDDRIVTLTAKGGTEQVEAETAVKTDVDYTWEPSMTEWLRETPLAIAGIIAAAIGSIISVWYYFKRYRYIKKFKDKIGELKETFVKMDNSYRSYAKTHDSEKLSSRQGDIQSEQRSIREEIKEIVEEHPFLQKKQEKTAKEIAEKAIKNLLSYYNESAVGKRAWLTGLTNFKANKIQTEIRDRYADKVKKIKEKQEEENKEEIKEKLMEKHGFNKNRAKSIMKYQEKRQEKIDKIKKMLSRERKTHQIKPQIKQEIKIGDEEFKEYRARQLIKKSGGDIKVQEPEPEEEEEEQEEKVQAKTKSGEKLGPKTGIEAKAEKEVKKTTKEQKEKQKKKQEEMDKKKKIKALKEMIQILEQKGMTEKQIKQEIKQQAKENGINPEKIEALLKQIEEE